MIMPPFLEGLVMHLQWHHTTEHFMLDAIHVECLYVSSYKISILFVWKFKHTEANVVVIAAKLNETSVLLLWGGFSPSGTAGRSRNFILLLWSGLTKGGSTLSYEHRYLTSMAFLLWISGWAMLSSNWYFTKKSYVWVHVSAPSKKANVYHIHLKWNLQASLCLLTSLV